MLQRLHKTLQSQGVAALNQAAALSGLGGIGKTQTALKYAWRYFYDEPVYRWVFWVRADTEFNLVNGLAEIARSHRLWGETVDELAAQAKRWLLETPDRWLLVFDNADDPNLVKPWLPHNALGRVLLTSRAQSFDKLGIKAPITVEKLSLQESIAFLQNRTGRPMLDAAECAAATALAKELDGLPLALEQAAAYIQRVGVSFVVYGRHYQQQRGKLLERGQPETGEYPQSVATTWQLNFEQVAARSPGSVRILQLSAVLAGDEIAKALLLDCAETFGLVGCTDELAVGEQLAYLADFSLIQQQLEMPAYSIHRMVQAVVWDGLTADEQQGWLKRAIAGLSSVFPAVVFEHWSVCDRLVTHVQAIVEKPAATMLETIEWAWLLNRAAYYLNEQGRYGEAEPLCVRALHIREQQLGPDHPDTASSLNNLAVLYRSQGRYGEAEPLYLRALHIREQQLGPDHPDTATSLNNLAVLYESQGRYGEAEPLYLRALHITEQQLGPDHPRTATSLNNLAALYKFQGRYGEAEPLYLRALHITEQQLGPDHPRTATSLNGLAALYYFQGRYGEAETLYLRALHITEQQLGPDHPHTATSLNNLAELYRSQGRYGEAEPLLVRALHIREQQLGPDHPSTAASLNNLAALYDSQGRYGEAEPLYLRALHIREQQLGPDHPDTATSLNNLAGLYYFQGQYGEAEPLCVRALHIREQQLGPDHPDTASSLNNLAVLYRSQGRYGEAEPLYLRALHIREQQLGPDHPDTATSLNNLAVLYKSQGRYEEAESLSLRLKSAKEKPS